MNNAVFGKTMENVRQYRDIKLVTTERTRNYLVSKPKCHTTKCFTKKFISNRNEKNSNIMNRLVYLALLLLDLIKTLMYEFWYDYVKPKYDENAKLSYIDTDSVLVHVKTDDIYKDIAKDGEKDLTFQIMKQTDHYQKQKIKK